MNKLILPILAISLLFGINKYNGDSTAPVVLSGSIVKNIGNEPVKKYPRKNCPVCKGTGKYLSGDGIKMVDCGYCEVEKKEISESLEKSNDGPTASCKCKVCKCKNCGC
jgi:hypothetical protein